MRLPLRYRIFGMRHATGHTDWHIVRQGILAILFSVLALWSLDQTISFIGAGDEVERLRTKLEIREQQIIRCLNGQAVGYVAIRDKLVYTICHPAEEIVVSVAD